MEEIKGSYSILNSLVALFREYQKNDMDCLILITSPKGFGKSTLSLQIAKRLHEKYLGTKFDIESQVVFTPEDVQDRIRSLPEYSALVWDEAVMGAMGEDWNRAVSRALKKDVTLCRTKHLVMLMNMPNIAWLDSKYRSTLVNFWIHIVSRGLAVWFFPDLRPSVSDCWHLDLIDKLLGKKVDDPLINPMAIVKKLGKHPCFQEVFTFPQVEKTLYQKYLELRNSATLQADATSSYLYSDKLKQAIYLFWKYLNEKEGKCSFNKMERILTNPQTNKPIVTAPTIISWIREIQSLNKK